MSDDVPAINWESIFWETRRWLADSDEIVDDTEPIPRDELIKTAKANGWSEREVRHSLRDAKRIQPVGNDLDTARLVQFEESTSPPKHANNDTVEPDISTPAPTPDDGKGERDAAVDALDDAIAYFTSKIDSTIADHSDDGTHPNRPTTGREYFRQREWNDETIHDALL